VIRQWTVGGWRLRATIALGPVAALLLTAAEGVAPHPVLVALVAGLALTHALSPESATGTVALGTVVVWWGLALGDGPSVWALPAAAMLLAAHVAALVAAYGPDGLGVDPATLLLWLRRAGLAFLAAPAVLLGGLLVRGRAEVAGAWVAALAAALVTTVAATVALTREAGE
jgi:hypothetical protein